MSALQDEVKRKLDYIKRIADEAGNLVGEMEINPINFQVLETINTQAELINVLIQKISVASKSNANTNDPELDNQFMRTTKRYTELAQARLLLELDKADADVYSRLRAKVKDPDAG